MKIKLRTHFKFFRIRIIYNIQLGALKSFVLTIYLKSFKLVVKFIKKTVYKSNTKCIKAKHCNVFFILLSFSRLLMVELVFQS